MNNKGDKEGERDMEKYAQVRIWSFTRHAWWRWHGAGYTEDLAKAGLYSREDAQEIVDGTHGQNEIREITFQGRHPYATVTDEIPAEPKPPLLEYHSDNYMGSMCPECGSDYPKRFWILGKRYCVNPECSLRRKTVPDIPKPPELRSDENVMELPTSGDVKNPFITSAQPKLQLAAASLREDELRKDLAKAQGDVSMIEVANKLNCEALEIERTKALKLDTKLAEMELYRTEHERLKGELNEILHPDGDGPAAPSFCDLVAFVRSELSDKKKLRQ